MTGGDHDAATGRAGRPDGARRYADHDDADLVERSPTDPDAFAELYRRHLDAVHAFAWRRTRDVHAAEDATAATFERALRGLAGYRGGPGGFRSWLLGIAAHQVVDDGRRATRAARPRTQAALALVHGDPPPAPGEELDGDEAAAVTAALDALGTLPSRYQRALSLAYLAGLPAADAAAALGVRRGTYAVVLHRARRALQAAVLRNATREPGEVTGGGES